MNIKEFLQENIVVLDGGMGTLLQSRGLAAGEAPETWNISHPDVITEIHRAYFNAGSNVVSTNTFGANVLKFSKIELEKIIKAAVENAEKAKAGAETKGEKFIALDLGPTGRLLKPMGDLDFEDAVSVFAETVRLGVKYGVDLILIETMNDSYETKAALLAAKENSELPVFVCNAYSADGNLLNGSTPEAMVALLEGMGADAVGANCSLGPVQLMDTVKRLLKCASVPVIVKPNAGMPKDQKGQTVYDISAVEFADCIGKMVDMGVRVVGGCCGTTPAYIMLTAQTVKDKTPAEVTEKNISCVSSYTHTVCFGKAPVLIGERINPTGKKRFKQALTENDIDYILNEGIGQQEKGVHILDVNVGLPGIDENAMLTEAVCRLQSTVTLPLQVDTSDPVAMESALRRYNGKAMINSVNGKAESMSAIFPLQKKYGGVVVALTLDENGIPETAEGRVKIAEKIIKTAASYGISKKDIVFDTLAMAISADTSAASVTLEALERIGKELGCHTSLGVSNVSFGLPNRDAVNSTFFAAALEKGMSAAIMNPYSVPMLQTYYSWCALHNFDTNCENYVRFISENPTVSAVATAASVGQKTAEGELPPLQRVVVKGLKESAAQTVRELLKTEQPLDIVNNHIIPALDIVGKGFEEKTVWLPQLLTAAEAAKYAFEEIKATANTEKSAEKCPVVIATVKGDIHDIGKNIVKLLLENYGFKVIDLGRDVDPAAVVAAVKEHNAPIAGLSALMTTTVPSMQETVELLHSQVPSCRVMVGGAVLTQEYAEKIGADFYGKDAMCSVRYAEEINSKL